MKVRRQPRDLQLARDGAPVAKDYQQKTLIAQIAESVFSRLPRPEFYWSSRWSPALILALAANTAFNGFPVLGLDPGPATGSCRDSCTPAVTGWRSATGSCSSPGRRHSRSWWPSALRSRALIQLYIVGVFVSFTLSQTGMVRHWTRLLRDESRRRRSGNRMLRSRVINGIGAWP